LSAHFVEATETARLVPSRGHTPPQFHKARRTRIGVESEEATENHQLDLFEEKKHQLGSRQKKKSLPEVDGVEGAEGRRDFQETRPNREKSPRNQPRKEKRNSSSTRP